MNLDVCLPVWYKVKLKSGFPPRSELSYRDIFYRPPPKSPWSGGSSSQKYRSFGGGAWSTEHFWLVEYLQHFKKSAVWFLFMVLRHISIGLQKKTYDTWINRSSLLYQTQKYNIFFSYVSGFFVRSLWVSRNLLVPWKEVPQTKGSGYFGLKRG